MIDISYRKLEKSDLHFRMKWLNDPETSKFLGAEVRRSTDFTYHEKWFEKYLPDKSREIFMILVDGQAIGQVGLLDINPHDKNACLYIIIGEKEYLGKGHGKRAVSYILKYAFKTLKLHKVWLDVHAENTAAINCYKSTGFKKEGHFKENVLYSGRDGDKHSARYGDEIRMAIFNPNSKK